MGKKVSIIDCGSGNILSVIRAFKYIDVDVNIVNSPENIKSSDRLVFPGVGTFSNVMSYINKNNLYSSISNFCISGKPFLGICLGMQILFEQSGEFGRHKGFGLLEGNVIKIKSFSNEKLKIPHTNWKPLYVNDLCNSKFKKNLSNKLQMYFTHSYRAVPKQGKYFSIYILQKYSNNSISSKRKFIWMSISSEKVAKMDYLF